MLHVVFIVGSARSGRGLLADVLAEHSEVVVAPEASFVLNLERKHRCARWNERQVKAFVRDLLRERRMRAWGLSSQRVTQRLLERERTLSYAEACKQVYESYARDVLGRSASWVADHGRDYSLLTARVARSLPDARYIHITRDYRANIFGRFGAAFGLRSPAVLAARWRKTNEDILRVSREAPERFLWLRYEDLLAYPGHELSRLCRFLGVELDPRMLARVAEHTGVPIDMKAAPPLASHALEPLPVRSWEQRVPEHMVRQADAICGEFAERFGYHPTAYGERLTLRQRIGALYGSSSVLAEKWVLGVLPSRLRAGLASAYVAFSRRLFSDKRAIGPKRA